MTAEKSSLPIGGTAVSKDPLCQIQLQGGNKGGDLKVSWIDNKGETDATIVKIQ